MILDICEEELVGTYEKMYMDNVKTGHNQLTASERVDVIVRLLGLKQLTMLSSMFKESRR